MSASFTPANELRGVAMRAFMLANMPVPAPICGGCELPEHLCDCGDDDGIAAILWTADGEEEA